MSDKSALETPSNVSLVADRVSVTFDTFRIMRDKYSANVLKRVGLLPSRTVKHAVREVSLIANRGESIGIVGRNGSGKSTLLRALSGLETMTGGKVMATSNPVFLGVSPALIQDRTGMENIRLGCLALGMTPKEMSKTIPKILEMADIGPAINDPIKTYSSGMGGRLRFAITAATPQSEILMIDEALNTGDIAFKKRSEGAMQRVLDDAGTIFLVSHSSSNITRLCNRAIWLHEGEIVMDSSAEETMHFYKRWAWSLNESKPDLATERLSEARATYRR